MAGFMSGPLGFASTAGAFIGGAAKQANELFAEQRAQARQDEIMKDSVWANKFDNAQEQERQQTKQRQYEANLFDTLKRKSGGDERVAFDALNIYRMNPKQDISTLLQGVENTVKQPGYAPDSSYTSPFASQQAQDEAASQARLKGLYNRLSPKYQNIVGPLGDNSSINQPSQNINTPNIAIPSSSSGFQMGLPLSKDPQTRTMLDDFGRWENEETLNAARTKAGLPEVHGVMTRDKMTAEEIRKYKEQHKVDEFNTNEKIRHDVAVGNAKDYLSELYKRKASMVNAGEIYNDANDFVRLLEQGEIKTNAAQPLVDGVNRLLSGIGFDILEKAGIANHVNNSNEAGKVLGRLMFGQIPNYHLGRWTDREFATLRQIIPEMGKDPNTNLKIALLLRAGAERSIVSTREELVALGNDAANPNVSAAMNKSHEHMGKTQDLPWISINTSNPTQDQTKAYNSLPIGGYWEDAKTGILHRKS